MSTSQNNVIIQSTEAFKIAQAIYSAVTGKTEKLSKIFSDNYKITEADILQLHAKCEQMCTQWNVLSKNENITIQHTDDNKQNFSSIERLKLYDKSQTSPVEGITAFFIFICYLHNVRLRRQRVADLLRYSDRRAATPCRQ